ncbi:hypothetical protein [Treponema sp.]|uniref:hypothetical protein n=1 Tax=Treponema sp. TaxID=166 RepID=UPI00257FA17E|nr:hypothetical protein [Treponema sp.]MBE6353322.1 hypothetical protein [Treponema sp.]
MILIQKNMAGGKKMQQKKFVLLTLMIFIFTSCADWFQGKVAMDTDAEQSSLSDFLTPEVKIDQLEAPEQVLASQGLYSGTIKLTWNAVDNATSYTVERAYVEDKTSTVNYDELDFSVVSEYCARTSYTDVILKNPGSTNKEYEYRYYYKITAKNIGEGYEESDYSAVSETQGCGWLLGSPKNTEASKGTSTEYIRVTWDKISNAVSYNIYRGEKSNGTSMELIDSVYGNQNYYENTVLTSEQGTEFYYKISAVTKEGTVSALSSIAMGYSLLPGAPETPVNVKVNNGLAEISRGASGLNVMWDEVETTTGTISYSVYRTSSQDSEYTLLASNLTTPLYTDKSGLKTSVYYYYYVQAVCTSDDGTKMKSPFSESGKASENPAVGFLLSPPTEIQVLDGSDEDHVLIQWKDSIGAEYDSINFTYAVYYSDNIDGPYVLLTEPSVTEKNSEDYYEFEVEKKAYYKLTTKNPDGTDTESVMSVTYAPMPSAPSTVIVSKTQKLSIVDWDTSYNSNNVYPVQIEWTLPEKDVPAAYYVYRSTSPDSGFKKITETPVTELVYVDYNAKAKASVIYYYKVVSLNNLYQGNKGLVDYGYGAITPDQWMREYNKTSLRSQEHLTLMHKPNDMDKLGKETVKGDVSGTLYYNAAIAGLGAEIVMKYTDYADYTYTYFTAGEWVEKPHFVFNGNSDTSSNMSANGNMKGTVTCTGMYPGSNYYNNLEIKSGAAGGGYYTISAQDLEGNEIYSNEQVNWKVGEEGR